MNPLELSGPDFLVFYMVSVGLAFVWRALVLARLRAPATDPTEAGLRALHPIEVAYLSGGWVAAADAATTALVHAKLATFRSGKLYPTARTGRNGSDGVYRESAGADRHPTERAILSSLAEKGDLSIAEARAHGRRAAEEVGTALARQSGFVILSARILVGRLVTLVPLYLLVALGLVKLYIGVSRDKPVGLLVLLLIAYGAFLLYLRFRFPYRTTKGDRALSRLRSDNAALEQTTTSAPAQLTANEAALSYGLFGATALGGSLALLGNAFTTAGGAVVDPAMEAQSALFRKPSGSSGSGSSCATGCGSSCGGGGGCGGCGGCGG